MKIHEYQAKELFRKCAIPVPQGEVADSSWKAYEIAKRLVGPRKSGDAAAPQSAESFVVKAQIHAGGRGKGGGVKVVRTPDEAAAAAESMFGMRLKTPQTGPEGRIVRKVLVEQGAAIASELYLAVILDRGRKCPVVIASKAGGMDIEEVASKTPEKVLTEALDPLCGFSAFNGRKLAFGMGLDEKAARQFGQIASNLVRLFFEKDCSLVEINPLIVTQAGELMALDAKINFDDNGVPRHPDIAALRDYNEEEPLEILASRYNIDYVKLDGRIGCMVNGAGLAMATMDIIKEQGAMPANFLDIKGGAGKENVINALKILTSDANVRSVLINIFGGIVKCDMVAHGIVEALKELDVKLPVVVRLEGTNAAQGSEILAASGFPFIIADGFHDAAKKAVASLGKGE